MNNIHQRAIQAALEGKELPSTDRPLAELARALARQVDEAGLDGPGTRLASVYSIVINRLVVRLDALPDREHQPVSSLDRLRANVADRRERGGAA